MDRMETEKTIKNYVTNLKKPVPIDTMAAELANLLDDEIRPGDEVIYKEECSDYTYKVLVLPDACGMTHWVYDPEEHDTYRIQKGEIVRKTGTHIDLSDLTKYIKENF